MLPKPDPIRNPKSPHPEPTRRALTYLNDRGAHFVLCKLDKAPLWGAWNRRKPLLEAVLHHGFVGIIPWSIDTTVLDVDRGEPEQLSLLHPPLVVLHSQCGQHAYYRDTTPRQNARFKLLGCAGEVRGAKGYVCLWFPESPIQLLFALVNNPEPCLFPGELTRNGGVTHYRPPSEPGEPYTRRIPHEPIDLRAVWPGNRNNSLFDEVRFWSYAEPKPGNMHTWDRAVWDYAQTRNREFRRPLPVREVADLSKSVSTWVWSGGGPTRHYTQQQRRRGGVTRGRQQSYDAREKHALVLAMAAQGEKQTVIAKHVGLSKQRVSQLVRASTFV